MQPPPTPTAPSGQLNFVQLGAGALAIGHRPPLRALAAMKAAGVTRVVTVLAAQEHPHAIAEAAQAAGLDWIWIELGSTKNLPKRASEKIAVALDQINAALESGGRIYLHCSAGIHRTGMIAAALLFRRGYGVEAVQTALASLRHVTARDVGAARLDWAQSFALEAIRP